MQVRAAHLPELRAPVVVRFREQDAEVIAEGEVVWRRVCANGGEFGVRFTALDSHSVQVLKALCGVAGLEELERGAPGPSDVVSSLEEPESGRAETDHDTDPAPPAALGVRLHIAGLTSPLQAQVKAQDRHSLEVGSRLDFLRVGSSLQLEDLGYGARRAACIEAVAVSVDEKSGVPELVVSLRYAEVPAAPQPAARSLMRAPSREPELDLSTARELDEGLDEDESEFEQRDSEPPPPLPRRVSPALQQRPASSSSALASERLAREVTGRGTAEQAAAALDGADQEDSERDEQDEDSDSPQVDVEGRDPVESSAAQPQARATDEEGPDLLRERLDGVLGGVSVAARVAGVQVLRLGGAASRGARWLFARAERAARAAERPPLPRRRTAAPPRSALRSGPLRQAPQLASQRPRPSEEPVTPARSGSSRVLLVGGLLVVAALVMGYVARRTPSGMPVPAAARVSQAPALTAATAPPSVIEPPAPASVPPTPPASASAAFDPTPAGGMAPAPVLGATVLGDEDEMGSEPSEAPPRAAPKAPDQSFAGSSSARAQSSEFGQGRLRSAVIYRLRRDRPAEGLRGERTPTGFEVTLAGRRVMESAASITKRDERIARVATHNTGQGTRVSFRFKDTIPGYKVRLRKDYVEFLISSP